MRPYAYWQHFVWMLPKVLSHQASKRRAWQGNLQLGSSLYGANLRSHVTSKRRLWPRYVFSLATARVDTSQGLVPQNYSLRHSQERMLVCQGLVCDTKIDSCATRIDYCATRMNCRATNHDSGATKIYVCRARIYFCVTRINFRATSVDSCATNIDSCALMINS